MLGSWPERVCFCSQATQNRSEGRRNRARDAEVGRQRFSLLGLALADAPDGWQDLSDSDEGDNDGDGDNAFHPDLFSDDDDDRSVEVSLCW